MTTQMVNDIHTALYCLYRKGRRKREGGGKGRGERERKRERERERGVCVCVCVCVKGTVSPYKRIYSNGSRMGIPNYTWASGVLTSRSRHLPVPSQLLDLSHRDQASTMVLSTENDFEGCRRHRLPLSVIYNLRFSSFLAIIGELP